MSKARVAIEAVKPELDCGRFSIKRVVGQMVSVEADVFADGHDVLTAVVLYRHRSESDWREIRMSPQVNDRWAGRFTVTQIGTYSYTIQAWVDHFKTWRRDLLKKAGAGQDIGTDLLMGTQMIEKASEDAPKSDQASLRSFAYELRSAESDAKAAEIALNPTLEALMDRFPDRRNAATYGRELEIVVDRAKAGFSAWYEMFPRSCSQGEDRHGTFKDCEERLPYIAAMGFDVLYFPPIHPIGRTHRKGSNNAPEAAPEDVGSPWAIGSEEGGHKSIHPALGTLEDFRSLVTRAAGFGLEIALDIAFQCSPDHPYVREHPEWFTLRPDGTVQYAENPPKKYEDIYPFNFETDAWKELWEELRDVVLYWAEQGVRIFRMDNPHTKPFRFWEWLIREVRDRYPESIFLAEAFTRPKVVYRLAKLGFTQSYTYFAWRNTAWELKAYLKEITETGIRDFFRPNFWPNTPDILTEQLQMGSPAIFPIRLVLAATLSANYGIYGPAFEVRENRPLRPGSEEYLDSEKYQLRHWDLETGGGLRDFIGFVNKVRRENPALQSDQNLLFHELDNPQMIAYSKRTDDLSNLILVVVNLDSHHRQSGWLELSLEDLGLRPDETYQAHDLLSGSRFLFTGARNYIELDPQLVPAHIFRLHRRLRTEHDFEYYL